MVRTPTSNVACFLVPDVDARGNTVTHSLSWFRPRGHMSSKGVCEGTVLSCTGGACSRGYRRGARGREAPKSLLEEELIEACANIGGSVVLSVAYYRMGPTATPFKGSPPPPFIDTRRDGVHAQGIVEVIVFPRIAGVQWSNTVGSTLWGHGVGRDSRLGYRSWSCGDRASVLPAPAGGVIIAVGCTVFQTWRGGVPWVQARVLHTYVC